MWQCYVERITHPFDSQIISNFPMIFAKFWRKRFELLWWRNRDGFTAAAFHKQCDGHSNTLTVILDLDGNIFGGFTPVKWDSKRSYKADDPREDISVEGRSEKFSNLLPLQIRSILWK
jgi:hypothetical protein